MENQDIRAQSEKQRIPIDEKGLEYKKWKNKSAFPVSAGVSDLSRFCNNIFDFHWHDGPELSVVVEGRMDYLVNDKQYRMEIGDCVFANSWAMHSGRAVDGGGCRYAVISFLPTAIESEVGGFFSEKYFGGMMDAHRLPSMFLKADRQENREIAELCLRINDMICQKRDDWELDVRGDLCRLWCMLRRAARALSAESEEDALSVSRIKKSIRFMNDNFKRKISLDDIAASCNLSKSEFCRCFKHITRQTPFEYLMDLRVRKSLDVLREEGHSVTEAALSAGFFSSSYYTSVFRRYMGCTPREYVKKIRDERK